MKTISVFLSLLFVTPAAADEIDLLIMRAWLLEHRESAPVSLPKATTGGANGKALSPQPREEAPPALLSPAMRKALGIAPQSSDQGCICGTACDCLSCECPKRKAAPKTRKVSFQLKDGYTNIDGYRWSEAEHRWLPPPAGGLSSDKKFRWNGANWERVKAEKMWPSYPSSPLGRRWTFNGGSITAEHLAGSHHAGAFDYRWLKTLSHAQLQALGSDWHNGNVRWQYVVRPTSTSTVPVQRVYDSPVPYTIYGAPQRAQSYRTYSSGCPGGNCPTGQSGRRTLFRR